MTGLKQRGVVSKLFIQEISNATRLGHKNRGVD